MIKILTSYAMTMMLWCLISEQWNLYKHIKTVKRKYLAMLLVFRIHDVIRHFILPYFFKLQCLKCNATCFLRTWRHFPRTFSRTFFNKKIILSQNLFFLSILQHVIASKSNHINTMLSNGMVLAPLQKLKIKYELSYQSTTRLKYIDKFYHLLIIHQWTSMVDNTTIVDTLHHFYLIQCSKTFPIIYKIIIK